MSDDVVRDRLLVEAGVYAKYGLRDKQREHLDKITAQWPDHADVVAAWAAYDDAVRATHVSVGNLVDADADLREHLGADTVLRIGRCLGSQRARSITLVERATLRFVQVESSLGAVSLWLGAARISDPDAQLSPRTLHARVAAFARVVENGDPGLGAVDDVVGVFIAVTSAVVVAGGGDEPPHVLGGLLRFTCRNSIDEDSLTLRIVIDVRVPRVVAIDEVA